MNTRSLFVMLIALLVSACAPSAQSTPYNATAVPTVIPMVQSDPVDRFAGTWSGTMSFTDDPNRKEDIIVSIPEGCALGSICGDINNITVSCQWEMTLEALQGNIFEYKFSKTMSGECPALGGGTLTMQSDGTLMREHKTPDFTASGMLKRK